MIEPGTLLQNRYRVTRQIGLGGMGAVYVATDERFNSTVAIKQTFFFEDPVLRKAFEREAILLNHLRHAALPKVSDHFVEDEGQFLVMEYIEGADLGALLKARGGWFPVADVLAWADELLDALEYLHTQRPSVVHRDIKPQNIKRTERGQIVLLDFGLAKGTPARASEGVTGSVVGYSPQYAPLEQVQGTGTDPRSDIYSLGATLYHLLTGEPPVNALSRAAAVVNNEADPLRPAHVVRPEVPVAVSRVIRRAMAQKATLRPTTAAEMRAMLRQAASGDTHTSAAPTNFARAQNTNSDATLVESLTAVSSAQSFAETTLDAERAGAHFSIPTHVRPRLDVEPERRSFSLTAKLLVVAAVVVVCVMASLPLIRRASAPDTPAPASYNKTQTDESPADTQTDEPDAHNSDEAGAELKTSGAAEPAQTPVTTNEKEASSSDAQPSNDAGAANNSTPAATPAENKTPIVIVVNPTPPPADASTAESDEAARRRAEDERRAEEGRRAEEARRAEDARRADELRRAEEEIRRMQSGPPPFGGPPPPFRGGPPPPPGRPPQ